MKETALRKSTITQLYMRISVICMALCFVVPALATPLVIASEVAKFDHIEFNFGQLPAKSFASHTFWIHATGADTIVIDTVLPGCGCTTIPLVKNTLAPGDSVAFEVLFNSKGIMGSVAKKPGFRLRGDSALYTVKFYASVVTEAVEYFPLTVTPTIFNVPERTARSGRKLPFELHNLSDEDIEVAIIDFPVGIFNFDLPDSIEAEGTITGHFSLLPGFPEDENIFNSVTFEVNHSQLYRLTAPILMKSALAVPPPLDSTSSSPVDSLTQGKKGEQ